MRTTRKTIRIVTPAPRGSRKGNRITALRWAGLLRSLGHRVRIAEEDDGGDCDVLVGLHALKSHSSIIRSHANHPDRPLIVALTGTDLYHDIRTDPRARESLELATRLIVLQRMGVEELPIALRDKARVIIQSVSAPASLPRPRDDVFEICVVGHLRDVKDPFRAAEAVRLLPSTSKARVIQLGAALSEDMAQRAQRETEENPRYRWLGELPRKQVLETMARCRLLVLSSRSEGGANVVCEALACSVPVLSSEIAGSIGILGADYPAYFPFGSTEKLAELMQRAETNAEYHALLKNRCEQLRPLVDPVRERACWRALLEEL